MQKIESGEYNLNVGALVEGKYSPPKTASTQSSRSKSIASKKPKTVEKEDLAKIDNILKTGDENTVKLKSNKRRFTDAELIAAANKKFKYFTVRKKDEGSLFEFISMAFQKNIPKLDQRAIIKGGSDRQINVIETQKVRRIRSTTNNFLRNSY